MVEMACEEHDRIAASTQAGTHALHCACSCTKEGKEGSGAPSNVPAGHSLQCCMRLQKRLCPSKLPRLQCSRQSLLPHHRRCVQSSETLFVTGGGHRPRHHTARSVHAHWL